LSCGFIITPAHIVSIGDMSLHELPGVPTHVYGPFLFVPIGHMLSICDMFTHTIIDVIHFDHNIESIKEPHESFLRGHLIIVTGNPQKSFSTIIKLDFPEEVDVSTAQQTDSPKLLTD